MSATILICRWNVFTKLLPRNDKEKHRPTETGVLQSHCLVTGPMLQYKLRMDNFLFECETYPGKEKPDVYGIPGEGL
jgi:hypothetical protein